MGHHLSNDVSVLSMNLSNGTEVPDDAEHFIDLKERSR